MHEEYWSYIKGVGDTPHYQVSTLGNVRRVTTTGYKYISQHESRKRGYCTVTLSNRGVVKTYLVHQLVANTFLQGRKEGFEVDHINAIRADNRVSNLQWVSRSENVRLAHIRRGGRAYSNMPVEAMVDEVFEMHNRGLIQKEIAEHFNVPQSRVSKALNMHPEYVKSSHGRNKAYPTN